jgi:phosphatidylserine decarboxylase
MFEGRRPVLAPAGRWPVFTLAGLAVVVHVVAGLAWAAPVWLMALALVWLFRDPDREIPPVPLGVVSPADGRVVAAGPVRDAWLERDAIGVTIRMRRSGVFVMRSPVEGKVQKMWTGITQDGAAANSGSGVAFWLQTDEGDDVVITVRTPRRMLRSRCYIHAGERVGQGQRCGLTPFGATVEVLMPAGSRVETESGTRVQAGADLIATLMRRT